MSFRFFDEGALSWETRREALAECEVLVAAEEDVIDVFLDGEWIERWDEGMKLSY